MSAPMLPLFLKVAGRRVLLVGAGRVAWWKLETLLAAGADVTVVAPDVLAEFGRAPVTVFERPFEEADLE
ncbi:MAG TPA: NAD(P)-dependent oxidoreductase, partial [Thermoanaerobaculia bacterium]|nr:NAD(P)-dependent oxidoreductase [Thermoanaerobaculia bacterium]